MFSVDYIHKSQDVSNRNLTNSKTQRLLREAYAIPYSMGPCEFLCWALSGVSRFFVGIIWFSRFLVGIIFIIREV